MYISTCMYCCKEGERTARSQAATASKLEITGSWTTFKILLVTLKLTVFILLAGLLQLSARTTAQTKISISLKGVTLEKAFAEIEKRSGYTVFYNAEVLKSATSSIFVNVKDATIDDVIHECLKGLPLEYTIQDKTIFVKKEVKKLSGETTNYGPANPKPQTVSGVVKSVSGTPLSGATVYILKIKKTGETNAAGEFALQGVPDGDYELVISYVGYEPYKTQISVVNHEAWVDAAMKQGTSQLDETVVKGYYSTTNRLNTGDVTTVKAEDIQKQPISDPLLALDGRVPGLYIAQTSGVPGTYGVVRIQGQNSIANGNIPLYIVDGVPYGSISPTSTLLTPGPLGAPGPTDGQGASPFNELNPADIESIEVLKDADATAIYGSRGANGVILITTKKGKAGNTRLNLSGFSGVQKVAHFIHFMNTPQYLAMRHEALNNDGLTPDPTYDFDLTNWDTTRYTNWQKVLIGKAAKYNDLEGNLSGGNANTQFRISGGYSNQGTVYPGSYADKKAMVGFSLTHISQNQRLHMQARINYTYDYSNLPSSDLTGNINLAPDAPALYNSDGSLNWQTINGSYSWTNPLYYNKQSTYSKLYNLIANLDIAYMVLPGLQIKSSFGYNRLENDQAYLTPAGSLPPPYNTDPLERSSTFTNNYLGTWIIEPQALYDKVIGRGKVNALIGTTFQQNLQTGSGIQAKGYATDALIYDPAAASVQSAAGYVNTEYRYTAGFGRIGYTWDEKYLVNLTGRRDGSSRFGSGKQFGNFGAIGVGWIFSKAQFFQSHLSFLSFGKLRGSYGTTGNDQIGDYQFLSAYSTTGVTYQGLTGLYPIGLTNPNFGWETIKKMQGGIELGFLNDRLLISANYYRNRSGNQLVGYQLPAITGYATIQANLPAIVQNSGAEISVNTINVKSKKFSWRSSANITIPRNRLVAFPNINSSTYANTYSIGQSLFAAKRYAFEGVNDTTGSFQYITGKSLSNNPQSPQDLYLTKPITQKFYGGIENILVYGGVEFSFLVQFVNQLAPYYFNTVGYMPGIFNTNYPTAVLNHWKAPGDVAPYARFSTVNAADPNYKLASSDFGLVNASFIRIKNVSLAYQVPKGNLQRLKLDQLRIFFQCQNLLTVTHNYLGLDPVTGGANVLPPLRVFTAGLQIGI